MEIPVFNPAKKHAPNAVSSELFDRSTFNFVISASNWQIKSFLDTPPSTLKADKSSLVTRFLISQNFLFLTE